MKIPVGTSDPLPGPIEGQMQTDGKKIEVFQNGAWVPIENILDSDEKDKK